MKRSPLVLLLAAAFCVSTAYAQTPRIATAREAGPSTSNAGLMKLPTTRPGSYLAGTHPLVTPPPIGLPELVLPPSFPTLLGVPATTTQGLAPGRVSPKKTAPRKEETSTGEDASVVDDGSSTLEPEPSAKTGTPPARRKLSNVFLSRDALQKTRDKCQVQLKTGGQLKFPTQGGQKEVRLNVIGGRSCVKAISASHDWLTVSGLGANDEVTVSVAENEDSTAREGIIVIANTGYSVQVKISQDANTSGFRRIEL